MATSRNYRAPYPANRAFVLARDGHVCRYCGMFANTADHVVALADGGTHAVANLVACCSSCNSRRSWERMRATRAAAFVAARVATRPSYQRALRRGVPTGALADSCDHGAAVSHETPHTPVQRAPR